MELLEVINVDFDLTHKLLMRYSAFIRQQGRQKWEHNGRVRQLFIDFKKAFDSVRREVL
jgi:hypothetical protein